jgi:hypothetical protein
MKKLIQYTFLLALLGGILVECKKGEDDPFLSLRRRKARVVGDWSMTSGTEVNSSGTSSTNYNYTENAYTRISVSGGVTTSTAGVHTLKISFEKDGSFTYTETQDGSSSIVSGNWNFTAGVGKEYKNREQITLKITSYSSTDPSYSQTGSYTGKDIDATFSIRELRNKKMVIYTESTTASGTSFSSSKTEYTMEQ